MTNVIGYKRDYVERLTDWRTMLMLKEDISFYKNRPEDFITVVDKNKRIYKKILQEYL